jgi:HPt (histidine-containing phosphotransfer) domain-containing protein
MGKLMDHEGKPAKYKVAPIKAKTQADLEKEKDSKKVNTAAHIIKGSSSSMRFRLMAKIAEKIESESNANWNDNLELQLAELKAEWEIVKKIIHQKII